MSTPENTARPPTDHSDPLAIIERMSLADQETETRVAQQQGTAGDSVAVNITRHTVRLHGIEEGDVLACKPVGPGYFVCPIDVLEGADE